MGPGLRRDGWPITDAERKALFGQTAETLKA